MMHSVEIAASGRWTLQLCPALQESAAGFLGGKDCAEPVPGVWDRLEAGLGLGAGPVACRGAQQLPGLGMQRGVVSVFDFGWQVVQTEAFPNGGPQPQFQFLVTYSPP